MTNPEILLEDRGMVYGDFQANANRTVNLLEALGMPLAEMAETHPEQYTAIVMIVVKLSRLMYAPGHRDSWDDISGYAILAARACNAP